MKYKLENGETIDTSTELTFEERNFIQKMMIYEHVGIPLEVFREKWRTAASPVRKNDESSVNPTAVVRILLDLEKKIQKNTK